jgi:hypothetical protein
MDGVDLVEEKLTTVYRDEDKILSEGNLPAP